MTVKELNDEFRSYTLTVKSWYYHVDYPDNHMQETTNSFTEEKNAPFVNTRSQWTDDTTDTIIERLTKAMIDEFGAKGITKPASENKGSLEWSYEITDADFEYTVKVPADVLASIARLEVRKKRISPGTYTSIMIQNEIDKLKEKYGIKDKEEQIT